MFQQFEHSQLRRYLVAFGSIFNNITIVRDDPTGKEIQRIAVPIQYGPKERWLSRLIQDPHLTRSVSSILPRISFEMESLAYDAPRSFNATNRFTFPSIDTQQLNRIYVGVPYTIKISMHLMVKFQQDGLQVIEQILPYFTPDLVLALKPVPSLDIVDQVPLSLASISHSDSYEGDFEKRRAIIWSLGFNMKGYLYGPRKSAAKIEEIMVDIYNSPFKLNDPDEEADLVSDINIKAVPLVQDPDSVGYPTANTTIIRYE